MPFRQFAHLSPTPHDLDPYSRVRNVLCVLIVFSGFSGSGEALTHDYGSVCYYCRIRLYSKPETIRMWVKERGGKFSHTRASHGPYLKQNECRICAPTRFEIYPRIRISPYAA